MVEFIQMFLWVSLFVVLVVVEIITLGITSIWFAFGALAAFITSLITDELWIQFIVFTIVSVLLLMFTKPIAKKYFNNSKLSKTNIDAMIGNVGIVTERVDNRNEQGIVVINGMEWTARSVRDSATIDVNEEVIIKDIKGVKLIVEKKII